MSPNPNRESIQKHLMDRETYNALEHQIPYIFSIQSNSHNLFYFWANHCFDPEHEQTEQIEIARNNFVNNTNTKKHAFIEANVQIPFPTKKESIEKAWESGLLVRLATQNNISFSCAEPTRWEEIEYLEKFFSKEDLLYSYYWIRLGQWHRQDVEKNREIYCSKVIDKLKTFPWRENEDLTIQKIKETHEKLFHIPFDYSDKEHRIKLNNPTLDYSITNDISRKSDDVREKSILQNIINKRNEDYDVFIVYWSSHAVIEEKALREFCK